MTKFKHIYMKGAFQLSMSFIVIVVIAVILLSLSVTFLTGIFEQINPLVNQVNQIARDKLLSELAESNNRVGIAAPAVTEWKRGETGSFAIGIRNKETDRSQRFTINVKLDSLGGALTGRRIADFKDVERKWFTYTRSEVVQASESKTVDLTIKPNIDDLPGIYLFRAFVCTMDVQDCDIDSPSLYDSATFSLEIVTV